MMTYYYIENREVKHISLNHYEYNAEAAKHTLYTNRKEAEKKARAIRFHR